MDFQQRYTGDDYFYEMEEKFLEEIETLPPLDRDWETLPLGVLIS